MQPGRAKSFSGCWTCRNKKRRCDGARPACTTCRTKNEECNGYRVKLVWVEPGGKVYHAQKERRLIPPEETWYGRHAYSQRDVDSLIMQCEHWATYNANGTGTYTGSIPFTVFHAKPSTHVPLPPPISLVSRIPQSVSRFLFHHFITVTAPIMAPLLLSFNPWSTIFATAALDGLSEYAAPEKAALYHAMLAHAATHVVQLGSGNLQHMKRIAMQNQTIAINKLRESIELDRRDYEYFITTILTLMLADIYGSAPRSKSWKIHFNGAWNYIKQQEAQQPWNDSELGLFSTHMILILVISMESTAVRPQTHNKSPPLSSTSQITTKSTVSKATLTRQRVCSTDILRLATNLSALSCLADINLYEDKVTHGLSSLDELDDVCKSTAENLDAALQSFTASTSDIDDPKFEKHLHSSAHQFIGVSKVATYIHLGRQLRDLPPCAVAHHVRMIFDIYLTRGNIDATTVPLWPLFIASVEAYESESITAARQWLQAATNIGRGNRNQVKEIVEEVWRRREIVAQSTGQDLGEVRINWRRVMAEMDIDVLLF